LLGGDGVEMTNLQEHNFEELDDHEDDIEFNNKNKKKNSGSKLLEKE